MQVLTTARMACSRGRRRRIDAPTTAARARGSGVLIYGTRWYSIAWHDRMRHANAHPGAYGMIACGMGGRASSRASKKAACCALCCARRDAPGQA